MTDAIYRFQVHYPAEKGSVRGVKFVADIRTRLYPDFRFRIETLIAMRTRQNMQYQYSQREAFREIWNAWEKENKKLVSQLPAKFPQKWQALKKLRQKEYGQYGNPTLMVELWNAWVRRNPEDARRIDHYVKELLKMGPEAQSLRFPMFREL